MSEKIEMGYLGGAVQLWLFGTQRGPSSLAETGDYSSLLNGSSEGEAVTAARGAGVFRDVSGGRGVCVARRHPPRLWRV